MVDRFDDIRREVAGQLSDWLELGHDFVEDNTVFVAETFPICWLNPEAMGDAPLARCLIDTPYLFHLLRTRNGPAGFVRSLAEENGHEVQSLTHDGDLAGEIDRGLVALEHADFGDADAARIVMFHPLALIAISAWLGERSALYVAHSAGDPESLPIGMAAPERFLRGVRHALDKLDTRNLAPAGDG